jgi:ser/thr protein phosphatase family protein
LEVSEISNTQNGIIEQGGKSMIDQSSVDDSTERWLDEIEKTANYKAWLCGHWHIDKRIDKLSFLFDDIVALDMVKRGF